MAHTDTVNLCQQIPVEMIRMCKVETMMLTAISKMMIPLTTNTMNVMMMMIMILILAKLWKATIWKLAELETGRLWWTLWRQV
jgi:hypothetical protein